MDCEHLDGFSQTALDHARNPRHHGPLGEFDGHARITGSCGDTMEFWVVFRNGKVKDVSFITDGCGPSLASGSMAACLIEGKPVEEAVDLGRKDILEALDGLPEGYAHCALLAADTLKAACGDALSPKKNACGSCAGAGECEASKRREGESREEFDGRRALQARLCRIRHKVIVLSGKGGVGKSMMAVNLAAALSLAGRRVGLLDVDIHGPSVPTMLGLEGRPIRAGESGLIPVEADGLKVMSLGFLLKHPDDAVIWRGPLKMSAIRQFLRDVEWGDLDYLVIDSPPGTGDEPLSVCQLIGDLDGAVIVTTPQKVAAVDVRKSIDFCRRIEVPMLGVVENMSGFACPHCGTVTQILRSGGGRRIASDMGVPFLGSIPMDPKIAEACDTGEVFLRRFADSPTAAAMQSVIRPIMAAVEARAGADGGTKHPPFHSRRTRS